MWRLAIAILTLVIAISCFIASGNVPNAFAKPIQQIYQGEEIDNLAVHIPVDGEYEVGLLVSRQPGESVPEPPTLPLNVTAKRNGQQIGLAEKGSGWSSDYVEFTCYKFDALQGETVHISVRPSPACWLYEVRTRKLFVARFPYDYATYFLNVYGRRFFGIVCLVISLALLIRHRKLSASKSQNRSLGSSER